MASLPTVIVSPKGMRQLDEGSLWVFASDIDNDISTIEDPVVQLRGRNRKFLGVALFNRRSQIVARLISRQNRNIDHDFFKEKIAAAINRRERIMGQGATCRLIHGEADWLPGLFVDRYNRSLSIQITSWALEQFKGDILEILDELVSPNAIVLRNDVASRKKEGLSGDVELYKGTSPVRERCQFGNAIMTIDLLAGQKSGGYLDQIENHARAARYAGGEVLDLFCYEGGFALAVAPQCNHVTAVDVSERALDQLAQNAADSKISNITTICHDAFAYLDDEAAAGKQYDMVILDPPAVVRHRSDIRDAMGGLVHLTAQALKVLKPGGVLVTCTCSALFTEDLLLDVVDQATRRTHDVVSLLELRGASPDHPTLAKMAQTAYLHAAFWQKQ